MSRTPRVARVLAPAVIALLAAAAPASATELLQTTVSTSGTQAKRCHARSMPGAGGVVTRRVTPSAGGLVRARLKADADSDWDLAVLDARTGRFVGGSAGPRSNELAEGFAPAGRELIVQACRLRGGDRDARLAVALYPADPSATGERIQLVRVSTPTRADKRRLTLLGLDLTEHGGEDFVEVVLHGERDVRVLRAAGFQWKVEIPDLVARARANQRANTAYALRTKRSSLPSGRDSYRHLADYEADLKELARRHPGLVKLITLNHKSLEGRDVVGVEITRNANVVEDGKPVFLQMGVHHAREWPSGEHAMEWAFELVNGYGSDPRTTRLVDAVRTIVVPVVNPDGFNLSREAPVDLRILGEAHPLGHIVAILGDPGFAYKRRNCRVTDGERPDPGECGNRLNRNRGVDPNRNYGGLWGGPGASSSRTSDTYRGAGPFSEPETQNVRELVSSRQVTTLITNHTYSNLVLRPPGLAAAGPPPDEPIYKDLGDRMASQNAYVSQRSYQLYDTTGTTEDWTYYATGGLGFTFEIGPEEFHPPFEEVVAEYRGHGPLEGKGNREAYFIAMEDAADTARHAVLSGTGTPGNVLRAKKTFLTSTSPVIGDTGDPENTTGDPILFEDTLDTTMVVPASGSFEFHMNPSTRPAVDGRTIVKLAETPSRTVDYGQNLRPTVPGAGSQDAPHIIDHEFTITESDDRHGLVVTLDSGPGQDYDLYVYRKDGGALIPVGSSASSSGDEQALVETPKPGEYVIRVENWLAADPRWTLKAELFAAGETVVEQGTTESWTVTCETPAGDVLSTPKVTIDRGERQTLEGGCGSSTTRSGSSATRGGSTGASGAPVTASGSIGSLRYAYHLDRRRLATALRRGLRARARCSAACRPAMALTVSRRTARRYGLRSTIVARGGKRKAFAGRRTFKVRFSREARRKLRTARAVELRMLALTRDVATGQRKVTRKRLRLKR